jgi:hypothetical protein
MRPRAIVLGLPLLLGCADYSRCLDASEGPSARAENGHTYQVIVAQGVTWDEARDLAEQRGGYLATITSAVEDEVVFDLIEQGLGCRSDCPFGGCAWNGGFQAPDGPEPTEGWSWVTGEPFSGYQAWADVEPNDSGGGEDVLEMCLSGGGTSGSETRYWNDVRATDPQGYVVEWDARVARCTPQ